MRVGDYAFADYKTDNLLKAIEFGINKMKIQRAYRSNTDDMYVSIAQFIPIRERQGNPIYAYEKLLSFDEEDLINSRFEKGGLTDSQRNSLGQDISNVADELRDNATEHLKDSMKFMKYAETLQREAVEHKEQAMELNKIQREADLYERGGKIEIESVSELYDTYFEKYPAATELVAYYIYGYKDDNDIYNMEIGKYGKPIDITPYSELMLDYEYTWEHKMPELDEQVKELMDNESMETGMFAKGGKISKDEAIVKAIRMGVDFNKDFHAQSYGNELSELARETGYRKSKSSSGSLGRAFFEHLEKRYDKSPEYYDNLSTNDMYAKGGRLSNNPKLKQYRGKNFEIVKEYDRVADIGKYKGQKVKYVDLKFEDDEKVYPMSKLFYDKFVRKYEFKKGGRVSKIDRDIRKFKTQLINKAKRKGIYENFGLNEVRKIEEKYDMYERDDMGVPNYQKLQDFNNWTMNYEPQFERGGVVEQIVKMGGEYDLSNMEHSIPNRAIRYNKDNSRYEIFNYMTDEVDYSDRQLEDILTKANRMFDTNF